MNAQVLKYYDPARETKISADSCMNGLGAILLQHYEDKLCPVSFLQETNDRMSSKDSKALALTAEVRP